MKKTIAFALSLLLLTASLTGCGRRGNVSENEDGMITDNTTHTESTAPTTTHTTQTEIIETTQRETVPSTSHTEPTTTETSGIIGDMEDGTTSQGSESTDNGSRARGRRHSGIMDGNNRY